MDHHSVPNNEAPSTGGANGAASTNLAVINNYNVMPFPILKSATILQIMAELEIKLTEQELADPGRCKERVREVLVQLLCTCWGITPVQLSTLSHRSLEHLQNNPHNPKTSSMTCIHPELYKDALIETKVFSLLAKLFRICGYNEFGFKDLQAPQARRFKRQLSALINFMKYREDMNHLLMDTLDEREEVFTALEEVAEEHMTLQDHLEKSRNLKRNKLIEHQKAEDECLEMEAVIAQHNKVQASIRQQNHFLQKSANELKDQIANLSIALRELQAEERQLSKKIVHSPDQIKLEVTNANLALENVKRQISENEAERALMMKRIDNAMEGENLLRKVIEMMDEMESKIQEYELVVEDFDHVRCEFEEVEKNLEEKVMIKETRKNELKNIEMKNLEITNKLIKELELANESLHSTVKQLGVVEGERLEGIARIEANQQRVEEMERRIELERKKIDEEIAKRVASFHEFEKSILAKQKLLNDFASA